MSVSFNNLSQSTRESLVDSLQRQSSDDSGTYVDITGDTMTGNLELPTMVVTGEASIAGPTRFTNLVTTDALSVNGTLTTAGIINSTSTINQTGVIRVNSNITLSTPMIIGSGSVLGGATIAPIQIIASTASQAFFDFRGAVISTASLNLTGGQMAGMVKVWISGTAGNNVGYLPIFKGVA